MRASLPFAVFAALAVAACSRNKALEAAADAAPPTSAPAPVSSSSAVPAPVASVASVESRQAMGPASPVEAKRSRVMKVEEDPALVAGADTLRKHFGGAIPSGLVVQSAEIPFARRRALLVADGGKTGTAQDQPMVLVVDDKNVLLWTKERPAGGIMPPVGRIAIAPGPKGRVAIAVCDAPTSSVALREWDEDGTAYADFQAMDADGCDDVSLFWWPRHGWIIVAALRDGMRAQLVSGEGRLEWGRGIPVGVRAGWRATAPAALAADSDDSFFLVQYAGKDQDHALAYRYDDRGAPMWPNAIDLGEVARVAPGQEHITLARVRSGVVHVKLASKELDLTSSGEIVGRR